MKFEENKSLKEEHNELQFLISSFLAPNENQEEIITNNKIEEFNIDKNIEAVSHEMIRNDLNLEDKTLVTLKKVSKYQNKLPLSSFGSSK